MYFLMAVLWSSLSQQALANHVVERLERQIRIDGAATVADEQREMMHLARFAGFEHQADLAARARADQMMMQAGHRQQRGDRRVSARQCRDPRESRCWRRRRWPGRPRQTSLSSAASRPLRTVGRREQNRQRGALESRAGPTWRSFSSSSFVRIGYFNLINAQLCGRRAGAGCPAGRPSFPSR